MAYATEANVEGEFKDIDFTSTSAVTSSDVARFIEEAGAEIDARIGLKYLVPVTGTASLILLRQICVWLVADRVRFILKLKTGMKELEQGEPSWQAQAALARKMLDQIVKGTLLLSDATLATSGDGVRSFAVDEDLEAEFQKGVDQW